MVGAILVWFLFPRHEEERSLLTAYAEEDLAAARATGTQAP